MSEHSVKSSAGPLPAAAKSYANPALVLLFILFLAVTMTWIVDSGQFQREGKKVVPGSYQVIEKQRSAGDLFGFSAPGASEARAAPVGVSQALMAVPEGITKQSGLIIMVLFIGGMFGILNQTGAISQGLEKILSLARGRILLLVPLLMLTFSAGSTFLGLAKEYLLLVPLVVSLVARLGLPAIYGLGMVVISVKLGYISSISNPYALTIAQPLAGVPIFSGMALRVFNYGLFLLVGTLFMVWAIRRHGVRYQPPTEQQNTPLSLRHRLLLLILVFGIGFMVFAAQHWHWKNSAMSAWYLLLNIVFSVVSGLGANRCADAFVEGMKKTLIAALLIGLATAVEIVLSKGKILDTLLYDLAGLVSSHGALVSGYGMFFSQLILDFAIPSTSGQAAVTMPILAPLGQLSGVSPQSTVLAFLLGHGLTNMITPTSSGLLVLLAAAQVGWWQWARFILPLFFIYAALALLVLTAAITFGY